MSPVATKRKRAPSRKKKKGPGLLAWWPLVLALVATPFAVRAASVLVLSGPAALRLLYPWVALIQAHAPHSFAPEQRDTLAEWMMWAQFPLYGLLASLLALARRLGTGLLLVLILHGLAIGLAILWSAAG